MDEKQYLIEPELLALEEQFRLARNPLKVWEAIGICCEGCIPFPQWVFNYLAQSAANLMDLACREEKLNCRAPFEVYQALGMVEKGSRNVFDRYQISKRNEDLVYYICHYFIHIKGDWSNDQSGIVKAIGYAANILKMEYGTARKIFYDKRSELGLD
jgi:hypothetical protein